MLYRNVFPVRLEVGLEVPICNRKSGRSKHSWGKHFPVVRDSIGEGPGGRNVIVTRIEFQPRDEFQFLPRGFAFRHLACRSDNFCLTLSFFLSRKINPVLKKDRKSTRLNSSHGYISYAVFCLKKKKTYRRSVDY